MDDSDPAEALGESEQALLVASKGIWLNGSQTQCIDIRWSDPNNGAFVHLWPCNETDAQRLTMYPSGEIKNAWGKCLDVAGWGTADGTPITTWDCHGGANQRWTFDGGSRGWIVGLGGKCLTASSYETGAPLVLSTCNEDFYGGQSWLLRWSTQIVSENGEHCWSGWYDSTRDRWNTTILSPSQCSGAWYFDTPASRIKHLFSYRCLKAPVTSVHGVPISTLGADLLIEPCSSHYSQRITWEDGLVRLFDRRCAVAEYTPYGYKLRVRSCDAANPNHRWQPKPATYY